jgi:cell division protein FtsB
MMTQGGISYQHKLGSPVLWRRRSLPVTAGFTTLTISINLVSPCDLLSSDGLDKMVFKIHKQKCEEKYHVLFLNELEKICSVEKTRGFSIQIRRKRFVVMATVALIVVVVVVPGIAMGGYTIYKVHKLEDSQEKMQEILDELEQQVLASNDRIDLLHKEIQELAASVDSLRRDFDEFQSKSVQLNYIIAYLTGNLYEGRNIIRETGKKWKAGELDEKFFDYLNITQPCGDDCPPKYGIFHSCSLSSNMKKLSLRYSVPTINNSLSVVEADPFEIVVKKNERTCIFHYVGPKIAVISKEDDCIYALHTEVAPVGKLAMLPSITCNPSLSFTSDGNYFKKKECMSNQRNEDIVQVKTYNNMYFIYCYGSTYELGKRKVTCPKETLPLTATFKINDVMYHGSVLNIVYKQTEDPLFLEKIQWHLNAHVNYSSLENKMDQEWIMNEKEIKAKQSFYHFVGDRNMIWITVAVIIFFIAFGLAIHIYCRRRKSGAAAEETQHGPAQTNHIIVDNT